MIRAQRATGVVPLSDARHADVESDAGDLSLIHGDPFELLEFDDAVEAEDGTQGRFLPLRALLLRRGTTLTDMIAQMECRNEFVWYCMADGDLAERALDDTAELQVGVRRSVRSSAAWRTFVFNAGVPVSEPSDDVSEAVVVAATVLGPDAASRTVLWCFGGISRSIPTACTDPRFGLLVALNKHEAGAAAAAWRSLPVNRPRRRTLGDPTARVRGITHYARDGYPHRSSSRAAGPAPVDGLRFDTVSDLLRSLTLRTSDELMNDIEGGRSLGLTTYVENLNDFVQLSRHVLELRALDTYRGRWDWVDHIVPVDDPDEEKYVLDEFVDRALGDDPLDVEVLMPHIPSAEDTDSDRIFVRFPTGQRVDRAMIGWPALKGWLQTQADKPGHVLLRRKLGILLGGHREAVERVQLLDCLVAELDYDGARYVLSDGEVLRVDKNFLERIDSALVRDIPWSDFPFPPYTGGTEPHYVKNAERLSQGRLVMLDDVPIRLEGQSPFEVCDLFADDRRLVFGKLKGRSAPFSHLCTQAETAAQMLLRHEPARAAFRERVVAATTNAAVHAAADEVCASLETRRPAEVTITLLLLGTWQERAATSLPLVSRMRLRKAYEQITGLGYRLELAAP